MSKRFLPLRRIVVAALALVIALGTSGAPALAGSDDHHGADAASRYGRRNGHHLGYAEGRRDALRDLRFGFWHDDEYQDATAGYRPHLGSIWLYRAAFREGYEDGYRHAYYRFQDRRHADREEGFEVQVGGIRFRWSDDEDDDE